MLVVGLGNPGKQYSQTRHNIGFIAVEALSRRYNFLWDTKTKFHSDLAEGAASGHKLHLVKPLTYMNLSGNAVAPFASYYRITPDKIYVIHDDIDLSVGTVKVKLGGGDAGHNGLKSITSKIGPNYHRIRIGVGRPQDDRMQVADYVLGQFSNTELEVLDNCIAKICDNFDLLLQNKPDDFKKLVSN